MDVRVASQSGSHLGAVDEQRHRQRVDRSAGAIGHSPDYLHRVDVELEGWDAAHDLDDGAGRQPGQVPDHRMESPTPRDPEHIVRLERFRKQLRTGPAELLPLEVGGSVHRPDDERIPQAVARRDLARELNVDFRRRSDLDANDPIPARVVEQAGDLEAGDAQLLGDLALARSVEEVPACGEHSRNNVEASGVSLWSDQWVHLLLLGRALDVATRSYQALI